MRGTLTVLQVDGGCDVLERIVNTGLVVGFSVIAIEVLIWRMRVPQRDLARLVVRVVLFMTLSWGILSSGLNPFTQAPFLETPDLHWLWQFLEVAWWFLGARLLTLFVDSLLLPGAWRKQRLFSDIFGAVVFLAATVAALGFVLELPVRGLVATSGALAIVLGLAIQSTLSDVFAGIVLNVTEPYSVGDWIAFDDVEGKVIEMNWRATHLLTGQGNSVIVPNAVASKSKIVNNSRPSLVHGISIVLEIDPEARPKAVLDAMNLALTGCSEILSAPTPYSRVKSATLNSIHYELVGYVDDLGRKMRVSNELFDLCYRHLASSGVRLRALGVPAPSATTRDERESLLKQVPLFSSLSGDEISRLAQRLSRHEYQSGHRIFAPGTIPESLSIIYSGVLSVKFDSGTGEREINRVGPGEAFGESGLLAGLPMNVTITTLTPCVLFQLSKEDMTSFLKEFPDVATQMCLLLAFRQDKLGKLAMPTSAAREEGHSLFHWLVEKVRHLHSLHDGG
ncbi:MULTISPECIES: mechanosensitive ion channel family protein [Burkholderiaceae]|uniref:mechanosensitive ion channel family protein n=1 Tax=Burkholderiaceae TaxID=119060 RepID=UPI000A50608D|nr:MULTISPECIES: mechanosensitive ion channel family protein [Burkholderiaceae]